MFRSDTFLSSVMASSYTQVTEWTDKLTESCVNRIKELGPGLKVGGEGDEWSRLTRLMSMHDSAVVHTMMSWFWPRLVWLLLRIGVCGGGGGAAVCQRWGGRRPALGVVGEDGPSHRRAVLRALAE